MGKKIRVLIVDDSAVVRQTLAHIFSFDPEIEIMAAVADPYLAAERMRQSLPDVITLDVEMPRMDGLTFLKKIMSQHPVPVVICSTLAGQGTPTAIRALEYGAVDIIEKPKVGISQFLEESASTLCETVKGAAGASVKLIKKQMEVEPKYSADVVLAKPRNQALIQTTDKVVAIGASTGGTEAIRYLLQAMPYDSPGIVIVQHMPEQFTAAFAKRLDTQCRIKVAEAKQNDQVLRGHALIAPGNHHLLLKRSGARYHVEIREGQLVSRHRPSVDVLFRSTAQYCGQNAVGILLTGMGNDGAKGLKEMRDTGAATIAQDEATSVVFGMPAEAIKLDAAEKVLGLDKIAPALLRACQSPKGPLNETNSEAFLKSNNL